MKTKVFLVHVWIYMAYEASFHSEVGSVFQSDGPDTQNERLPHEW